MFNTNITTFRKNIFSILDKTIKHNEPVSIHTKDGNAIVISEDDYNGLMETLFICSVPNLKEEILEGMKTPVADCIPASEVNW